MPGSQPQVEQKSEVGKTSKMHRIFLVSWWKTKNQMANVHQKKVKGFRVTRGLIPRSKSLFSVRISHCVHSPICYLKYEPVCDGFSTTGALCRDGRNGPSATCNPANRNWKFRKIVEYETAFVFEWLWTNLGCHWVSWLEVAGFVQRCWGYRNHRTQMWEARPVRPKQNESVFQMTIHDFFRSLASLLVLFCRLSRDRIELLWAKGLPQGGSPFATLSTDVIMTNNINRNSSDKQWKVNLHSNFLWKF